MKMTRRNLFSRLLMIEKDYTSDDKFIFKNETDQVWKFYRHRSPLFTDQK